MDLPSISIQTLQHTYVRGDFSFGQGGGGGGGASREDVVYEKASELLERLPEDYIEDDYKAKLQKLGGLAVPLNIFLFQVMGVDDKTTGHGFWLIDYDWLLGCLVDCF